MKICAVICEFNPFHNGHKYLLQKAKELSGCDEVLCVMSGNFVQRAEPSIIDKYSRAEAALESGASIVAELPFIYATASAGTFASGAVQILSSFKDVTHIAFGCEDDDPALLKTLARIAAEENEGFKNELKKNLKQGFSYAKSYADSLAYEASNQGFDSAMCGIILSKPNNLLAIEYLKCLIKKNSSILPVPVKRLGSGYNDANLTENFSSASALRQAVYENKIEGIRKNVPDVMFAKLCQRIPHFLPDEKVFEALIIDALRNLPLEKLPDSGEGLEIKLKKNALLYTDLDTVIARTKSKRYTYAKIKRLCLQALFQVKNELFTLAPPIRILGIRKEVKPYLKNLPFLSILQNSDYLKLSDDYSDFIKTEKKAAYVYSLITHTDGESFYSNKLLVLG